MSKITKALEKAARDRARRAQDEPIVHARPTEIRVTHIGPASTRPAGQIQIDPHLVAAWDPKSPISEQYRILRTNLQSIKRVAEARTLLVTSSVHDEGKSVTSINLALTMAQQEGMRVLLIDADLRRPSIHRWLGLDNSNGLSEALQEGGVPDERIVALESPPLSVMPAGNEPKNPAELLDSTAMKRLMDRLKQSYDIIIIDSPPMLPVADPGIVGRSVDGVLFVVRAGRTQQRTVLQAFALLKQAKVRLMGCVLTHVEHYIPGYYRYYQYYRYGNKDGASGNGSGNGHATNGHTETTTQPA
jgi:capsular exopolysaccharide synthesis family protein